MSTKEVIFIIWIERIEKHCFNVTVLLLYTYSRFSHCCIKIHFWGSINLCNYEILSSLGNGLQYAAEVVKGSCHVFSDICFDAKYATHKIVHFRVLYRIIVVDLIFIIMTPRTTSHKHFRFYVVIFGCRRFPPYVI